MHNRADGRSRRGILLTLLLFLGAAVVAAPARSETAATATPSLVFLTQSEACDCVRNLCVAGEQEVLNFVADRPEGFQLVRIDLTTDPQAGREYRAVTMPVAVLRDKDGTQVARFDSFFTQDQLQAAWVAHLADRKDNR